MPERNDHNKISSRRADLLDYVARALAVAERRFRRADQLRSTAIRRWLFPIPFGGRDQINATQRGFHSAQRTIRYSRRNRAGPV